MEVKLEQYHNNEYDCEVYEYYIEDWSAICDYTDVVLLLRQLVKFEEFVVGEICHSDDYVFNGFMLAGCDLIDLCKKYDI